MNIDKYQEIKSYLDSQDVTLVAVSKTHPVEKVKECYDLGQRIFGENRVQELIDKQPALPDDIKWHLIGHLQTNKVKYIAPFIAMIESVDSAKLLELISKEGVKNARRIDVLLQFKIAREETKFGFELPEVLALLESSEVRSLPGVQFRGVMGMASFVDDENQLRSEFRNLHDIFISLKSTYFRDADAFDTISMGMSGYYRIAVEEGSTMVRLGSVIFGPRQSYLH